MKIAVFCSANADIDPRFFKATEAWDDGAQRKGTLCFSVELTKD